MSDEWNFFLQGQARVTLFIGPQSSRTFEFQVGGVGYVPVASGHYVENIGNETVLYIAPKFTNIGLGQWLGLTPAQVVKETLNVDQSFIDKLPKTHQYVISINTNLSMTNSTVESYPNDALDAGVALTCPASSQTSAATSSSTSAGSTQASVPNPMSAPWRRWVTRSQEFR